MGYNHYLLLVFAPLLVLTGIAGFVIPKEKGLTSGEAPYNIFHIIFGSIGIACVLLGNDSFMRWFNIGFGVIDLYQAAASFLHFFPENHFKWKRADDLLHIVIGAVLVLVGIFGS